MTQEKATFTRMEASTADDWRRIGGEFQSFDAPPGCAVAAAPAAVAAVTPAAAAR